MIQWLEVIVKEIPLKKDAMDLKESNVRCIGGFEGEMAKGEFISLYYNLKKTFIEEKFCSLPKKI